MAKSFITRFASLLFVIALVGVNTIPTAASAVHTPQSTCIIYVDQTAPAGGNGMAWLSAYNDLQTAIAAAASGCQVWVTSGSYTPTGTTNRDAHFALKSGVALYGGFVGNETSLAQRDWQANVTTLSGEIGAAGTTDNSKNVVYADSVNATARLDGFTITAGNATTTPGSTIISGGGLYNSAGSPFLANLTFTANSAAGDGGGMANYSGSPTLLNVTFSQNYAFLTSGGGFYNFGGSPRLVNVSFFSNSAYAGGGMASELDDPTLTNVVFANNTTLGTTGQGAGLFNLASSPVLDSVTFVNNVTSTTPGYGGGAIYNSSTSRPVIHNSILWGNTDPQVLDQDANSYPTFYSSDLQGGCQAGFNCTFVINQDPLFVNPSLDDARLQLGSPAIDAGDNSLLPADVLDLNHNGDTSEALPLDRGGSLRQVDIASVTDLGQGSSPIVDMGAYEARDILYVAQNAVGLNNGSSWQDAYPDLQNALASAISGSQVWVATGTYAPTSNRLATNVSFQLKQGVALYGGFAGTETNRSDRRQRSNPTILDGYLGFFFPIGASYSCHVVTGSGLTSSAVLDGFTIRDGKATAAAPCDQGGGIYLTHSSPTLADLRIENNRATNGAGLSVVNSNADAMLVLNNVAFYKNAAVQKGGGVDTQGGPVVLTNATFNANTAPNGAGIYKSYGSLSLQNDLLWSDTGASGEIVKDSADPTLVNIDYSLVQGCYPLGVWTAACGNNGTHNRPDADPLFVNAAQGDLHLRINSPAANQGLNPQLNGIDLDSSPRIMNLRIDLGAYELPNLLFVNPNAPGPTHDGSTWNTAFTTLPAAIAQAATPSWAKADNWFEIWVAKGTYTPTQTTDRYMSFLLHHYTSLYGGFNGHETAIADRDLSANPSILSGDLQGDDGPNFANNADNSYHVVTSFDDNKDVTLDGFTITAGNANGSAAQSLNYGAGIRFVQAAPRLSNLIITNNQAQYGGGLEADNGISKNLTSTISNVTFLGNWASAQGGGILNNNNSLKLYNVALLNNHAGQGGGIYNDLGNLFLINTTFNGNMSSNPGGGLYNLTNSFPNQTQVINSILWGDTPDESAGTALNPAVVSFSLIQGCNPGNSWNASCGANAGFNLADIDPLFADPAHANLSLRSTSPAIDMGNDLALPPAITTDRSGNPRFSNGGTVDLGAYEFFNLPPVVSNFQKWGNPGTGFYFTLADFTAHYSDFNADPLVSVTILTLPAHGKLYLGVTPVVAGQTVQAAALNTLVYDVESHYKGAISFQWTAYDGTTNSNTATVNLSGANLYLPQVKK